MISALRDGKAEEVMDNLFDEPLPFFPDRAKPGWRALCSDFLWCSG